MQAGLLNSFIHLFASSSVKKISRILPMAATLEELATNVSVTEFLEPGAEARGHGRPAHHLNDHQTKFTNPWPSCRTIPFLPFRVLIDQRRNTPKIPENLPQTLGLRKPDWGVGMNSMLIKATWLGHACYLVELPTPEIHGRGPRILFDPALSHRCSPVQFFGPERITPVPCDIQDIPAMEAIALSHNHYDHTDSHSLQTLWKKYKPHVFAPLGNGPYLESLGITKSHIHILDWWDARVMSLTLPHKGGDTTPTATKIKITCLPSQHISNRGLFDRGATLWSSWAVEQVLNDGGVPKKVYFAGDTGYRTVHQGEDENSMPRCPAFAEIGERIGPFDLALIPIGVYAPKWMWSNYHSSPSDAVEIFKDIKAKKALAMHWGTWVLTTEPVLDPPEELKRACQVHGVPEGDFDTCGLGETRCF